MDYSWEDTKEELPQNIPKAIHSSMALRVDFDSDNAGDQITRRSRTGFAVFFDKAPIYWFSKNQTSCETSNFGSEFMEIKQATEYVLGFHYNMFMTGIPVDGPLFIYGDKPIGFWIIPHHLHLL